MDIGTDEDPLERLPQTAQMRQDLQDAAARAALRSEFREGLSSFYPEIREELRLTAQQLDELFDLLADHQMRHMDIFYARQTGGPAARMPLFERNEAQRDGALLSLLGPETLEDYRRFQSELPERQFVAELFEKLDPTDALSPGQRLQLRVVVKTERERAQRDRQKSTLRRMEADRPADTPAQLREINIRANEDALHEMEAQSGRVLRQAASFLTSSQLATLLALEAQKLEAQRSCVRNLRTDEQNTDLVVTSQGGIVTAHRRDE